MYNAVTNKGYIMLTYSEWVEKYKPIQNPFTKDSLFNNTLFNKHGDELKYIEYEAGLGDNTPFGLPQGVVWTHYKHDNGEMGIMGGFHYFDVVGYFITETPYESTIQNLMIKDEE
jgi:hypothetical protein